MKTQNQNNSKPAIVYCRVSTDDQATTGISIETQENVCVEAAKKDGYQILEVIKDEGRSGGNLKRPGIQKLLKFVLAKEIGAIYTVHSDRLARNTLDHLNLMDLFRKNEVILNCTQQPNMDDSATSRMISTVMASTNQFQRDITSEKVSMTMREKAKAGYFPSKAPVGYKNISNPDMSVERMGQKSIIIDPNDGPLVKKAFELYSTGTYNVYALNDILFEKGLRTRNGNKRSDSHLFNTLRNRFYLGEVHWKDVLIKNAKHQPLVSEEVFNQVQKIMASKNKSACRRRKYSWLLSGFVRCYKHDRRYTAEWHLNKKKAYYHCTNPSGCGKCIEVGKLEDMVAEKFKTLEFSPVFIEEVIDNAKAIFYERKKTYDSKRKDFINQRTAFEIKQKVVLEKLFAKVISDDDFTKVKKQIEHEIENIDARLIELEKQKNVNIGEAQDILNFTRNIYDAYQKASPALKRQVLAFFWNHFEVADGLIIKSNPSLLFDQLLKLEHACQKVENSEKPIASNMVINSSERCA